MFPLPTIYITRSGISFVPRLLFAPLRRFIFACSSFVLWTAEKKEQQIRGTKGRTDSSSYFAVFTRGGKESKMTGMKMKAGLARESPVNELICIENDRDDGSSRHDQKDAVLARKKEH